MKAWIQAAWEMEEEEEEQEDYTDKRERVELTCSHGHSFEDNTATKEYMGHTRLVVRRKFV